MAAVRDSGRDHRSRLGLCQVCKVHDAKYSCPSCLQKSCSLSCVNEHKKNSGCEGLRTTSYYISADKLSKREISRDISLLQEVGDSVLAWKRDKRKRVTRLEGNLPLHLIKLRKAAFTRGCRLLFLPQNFARHKKNTTYFNWSSKVIQWKLELKFLNAGLKSIVIKKCDENISLRKILQQIIFSRVDKIPSLLRHSLEPYEIAGLDSLDVLMKAEKLPENDSKFYKLDLSKPLKENLRGKVIIENPILFVGISGFYSASSEKAHEARKVKSANYLFNSDPSIDQTSESSASKPNDTDSSGSEMDDLPLYAPLLSTAQ